mmetsp:Transcript_37459/g.87707  ORF Transcript_37459/g.87707 Transcript_37459/m.87707 type:complete len:283 (-) Transcript_37459:482-1330(-)
MSFHHATHPCVTEENIHQASQPLLASKERTRNAHEEGNRNATKALQWTNEPSYKVREAVQQRLHEEPHRLAASVANKNAAPLASPQAEARRAAQSKERLGLAAGAQDAATLARGSKHLPELCGRVVSYVEAQCRTHCESMERVGRKTTLNLLVGAIAIENCIGLLQQERPQLRGILGVAVPRLAIHCSEAIIKPECDPSAMLGHQYPIESGRVCFLIHEELLYLQRPFRQGSDGSEKVAISYAALTNIQRLRTICAEESRRLFHELMRSDPTDVIRGGGSLS